jgi:hypothetical protein
MVTAYCIIVLFALIGQPIQSHQSLRGIAIPFAIIGVVLLLFRRQFAAQSKRIGSSWGLRLSRSFWECTLEKDIRFFYAYTGFAFIVLSVLTLCLL